MASRTSAIMLFTTVTSMMLLSLTPMISATALQDSGNTPNDLWSDDYVDSVLPWGGDERVQFNEYHDYDSMKLRMMRLAEENPDIFQFHEGMNGGVNKRGETMTLDSYEGWHYSHASPWMKITKDVSGGDTNLFVGDTGNYEDRPDVLIVGNHHAREWMSYSVPLLFLEYVAFSYDNIGYDNDGDGKVDEDPWGDADGDGIIDDDGDCLSLANDSRDSNGDGNDCGPGDLGVDEDFSEQWITDLVNSREIYVVPMLNVDGNIYDREEFCPAPAWESCPSGGWRKNLRNNGPEPLPDLTQGVDEDCDGVDLNRNYQFEWGWPLGATIPLIPGTCTPAEDERAGVSNNDVYTGPFDTTDNDGDGLVNEDNVDGEDDDNDGKLDEDWAGGNSEPETKFIQDLTEMNDDNGDGSSEFKATLTWHSYSELVLYPWGHCQDCETTDHEQLIYHGDVLAEYTNYTNMQSSDLYPTTGDFCDWQYGVHDSYCYTMEIGTAFHQNEIDIKHIAIRNLGVSFYMAEIADNPREKANLGLSGISQQFIQEASEIIVPEYGDIPIDVCLDSNFPYSLETKNTHLMWRMVKPTRQQSDYGPREWSTTDWGMIPFQAIEGISCTLRDGDVNGTVLRATVPVSDVVTGELHYKAMLSTLSGSTLFEYPPNGNYNVLDISYRAPYGGVLASIALFGVIVVLVWGGLGVCLRLMMDSGDEDVIMDATLEDDST
jgi:hypothetical protein